MPKKPTYEELENRVKVLEKTESDRNRALEALKDSEERYRTLFEQSNDAIIIQQWGRIRDVNQRACEMLGYSKEQLLTMSVKDFHPEETDGPIDFVRKGESILFETIFVRADGSLVMVEVSSNIVDFKEEIIQGIVRDVTKRKQAEIELLASEAKLRAIIENIREGIAVYKVVGDGEDFLFIDLNRAGERLEGINRKDLIGKSVLDVFPGIADCGLLEVFRRVWTTGEAEQVPVTLCKEEGREGRREYFVCRLPPGEIVVIYSDETKRKRADKP